MNLAEILALLVVAVAVPLNVYVAVMLTRLSHGSPGVRLLRERAVAAITLALNVSVFAAVFVNNEIEPPPLEFEATKILTRGALLTLSTIPAVYWLRLYRRGP